MTALLRRYWFFPAIVLVVLYALGLDGQDLWVRKYHVMTIGIFLAFFATGLTLDTSHLDIRNLQLKAALAAVVSSLVLIPLLSWALAYYLLPMEFIIGICIITTAPVSIVSGTVMTAIGRGNIALSALICLLGNSVGIFTIPFSLQFLVGEAGNLKLPILKMLASLITSVLVPIVLGKLAQRVLKACIARCKAAFSVFQQCIVLLIIFNAFAGSGSRIGSAGAMLPALLAFIVGLHSLILLLNFGICRVIRLDRPSTTAFTIHTSQKTLTVSYLIWAGCFAVQYPLSVIPSIVYHLTQMVMDTFVAERFRKLSYRHEFEPTPH